MPVAPIDWSEFYTRVDGKNLVVPCVCFRLLLHHTSPEIILDFYQKARELLAGQLTHYATGDGSLKKITERSETMVPTWCKKLSKSKTYYIEMTGCGDDIKIVPDAFVLNFGYNPLYSQEALERKLVQWRNNEWGVDRLGESCSDFVISLSVDHPMAAPVRFREWILSLLAVNDWPFINATAGYGIRVYANASGQILKTALERMRSLARRHIGLELPYHFGDQPFRWDPQCLERQHFLLPLIRRANWLTLVSDISLNHLGGREWVIGQWRDNPQIIITPLKQGLMIQAGSEPVLGTLERGDTAPLYRAVAKVLHPIRGSEVFYCRGGSNLRDACVEWVTALDRDYPKGSTIKELDSDA
jgi:hypothetical protein